jgi:hypothetical protein
MDNVALRNDPVDALTVVAGDKGADIAGDQQWIALAGWS